MADALQWIFEEKEVRLVKHYLDDFIMFAPLHSEECQEALDQALCSCVSGWVSLLQLTKWRAQDKS